MNELNWGEHIEAIRQHTAKQLQNEQEQRERELERQVEKQRTLHEMNVASYDFIKKAWSQGYPGAIREVGGLANFGSPLRVVTVPPDSVSYMSRQYSTSYAHTRADSAWIASTGDWVFHQYLGTSEGHSDYITYTSYGQNLSAIHLSGQEANNFNGTALPRFMHVLAEIAIDNSIDL